LGFSEKNDFKEKIKDLKIQKEFFELLLNFIPDGLLVLNERGEMFFANHGAKTLLRFKEWGTQDPPDWSRCPIQEMIHATQNLDFLSYHREIEILEPVLQYLNVVCVPLHGSLIGENAIFRVYWIKDITREKMASGEAEPRPAFTDNITFSAGLAHELGNPIASLSLHAQLLKRLISSKNTKTAKKQMESSIDVLNIELTRLDNTIHQFLDAVRPTLPQMTLQDVENLVKEVMKTLEPVAKEKWVTLALQSHWEEDLFLMDALRIKQALTNVILNAIEFSNPESFVEVLIQNKKGVCEVSVKDTGKGISSTEMMRIFDPYYTTKENGNGLGLLITYRILKDHGGGISFKSKLGQGSTFFLSIPIRRKAVQMLSSGTSAQ
jgi:signal transduction histidine kinase